MITEMPLNAQERERLALLLLLGGALLLRLTGLQWGLPDQRHLYSYHPDEPTIVVTAHAMAAHGDWNPHFFNYGSLAFYLVAGVLKAADTVGAISLSASDWGVSHLLARLLVALLGTATVGLLFLVGKRLGGLALGLAAAGWLAVMPLHVVHSHYATVDVMLAWWVLLVVGALVRLGEVDGTVADTPAAAGLDLRERWAAAAGAALGLAVATKINAAALWVILAPLLGQPWKRPRAWAAAALTCAGAFLLACPYAVLDHHAFLRDVLFELRHAREGGTLDFAGTPSGWWYHLSIGLPTGIGLPGTLLALAGLGWGVSRRDPRWWAVTGAILVQYAVIGGSAEKFIRYLIPLLPLLALCGAGLTLRVVATRPAGCWGWLLLGVVLVGNLAAAAAYDGVLARPDARDRAADWAWRSIPPGHRVGLGETPFFFTPPLWPYNGGIRSKALLERETERLRYRPVVTGWDVAELQRAAPPWFVLSEFEYAPRLRLARPADLAFWKALQQDYELVWRDKSLPSLGPLCFQRQVIPHDWRYPNPEIRIYRRKAERWTMSEG